VPLVTEKSVMSNSILTLKVAASKNIVMTISTLTLMAVASKKIAVSIYSLTPTGRTVFNKNAMNINTMMQIVYVHKLNVKKDGPRVKEVRIAKLFVQIIIIEV
jgi:hypothetical protein